MKNYDKENIIKANPKFSIKFEDFILILIFIAITSNLGNNYKTDYYEKILNFYQRIAYSEKLKKMVINTGRSK